VEDEGREVVEGEGVRSMVCGFGWEIPSGEDVTRKGERVHCMIMSSLSSSRDPEP